MRENDVPRRNVVLTAQAGRDFDEIIEWTAEKFGRQQAETYERLILATLRRLGGGYTHVASSRVAGHAGVRRMPVGDGRNRGPHFLYFQDLTAAARQSMKVLRILHAAMDPMLHLPADDPT